MNNIFKFSFGILSTLAFAWLAFVVGASLQYGDLSPEVQSFEQNGSEWVRPTGDNDFYPKDISGLAKQGAEEYLALGCATCHTQQVRLFTRKGDKGKRVPIAGTDIERGWGKRASMPRDYISNHVMLGNTRIGPDLASVGMSEYNDEWLHQHLFEPESLFDSICHEITDQPKAGSLEIASRKKAVNQAGTFATGRQVVAYLKSLKQDYELPEMSFFETEDELVEIADSNVSSGGIPDWVNYPLSPLHYPIFRRR